MESDHAVKFIAFDRGPASALSKIHFVVNRGTDEVCLAAVRQRHRSTTNPDILRPVIEYLREKITRQFIAKGFSHGGIGDAVRVDVDGRGNGR